MGHMDDMVKHEATQAAAAAAAAAEAELLFYFYFFKAQGSAWSICKQMTLL